MNHEVEVRVPSSLFLDERIDTPATVEPKRDTGSERRNHVGYVVLGSRAHSVGWRAGRRASTSASVLLRQSRAARQ